MSARRPPTAACVARRCRLCRGLQPLPRPGGCRLCRPVLSPLQRGVSTVTGCVSPRTIAPALLPVSPGAVTPPARRFRRYRLCVAPHCRPRGCRLRCPAVDASPAGKLPPSPHTPPGPIRIDWKSPSICLFFFLSFIFFCCYFISFNFSVELSNVFFLFFLLFQWEGERKKERKKEREREREIILLREERAIINVIAT